MQRLGLTQATEEPNGRRRMLKMIMTLPHLRAAVMQEGLPQIRNACTGDNELAGLAPLLNYVQRSIFYKSGHF